MFRKGIVICGMVGLSAGTGYYLNQMSVPLPRIKPLEIDDCKCIGSGCYGDVYKGLLKGRPVAIKNIRGKRAFDEPEIELVQKVNGRPGIANYIACAYKYNNISRGQLIMQLYPKTMLSIETLTDDHGLIILKDIVTGINECRKKGIVHRDIKEQNIVLDTNNRAYLIDFSIARKWYFVNTYDYNDVNHAIDIVFDKLPKNSHMRDFIAGLRDKSPQSVLRELNKYQI